MKILLMCFFLLMSCQSGAQTGSLNRNVFDKSFWNYWGDGRAELAGYELTTPRYGELRKGVAVSIFVTEPFSNSLRVKADPGKHPKSDEFQVMKLNLIQDFPTGIYDYNVMSSVFVGLEPFGKRPAGSPAKISFTSQEWCGHVYDQLSFYDESIKRVTHSYFDGEADREETLRYTENGISADVLFFWAREFTGPFLEPGESQSMKLLMSLMDSRFRHKPLKWESAKLTREKSSRTVKVPAGSFDVDVKTVSVKNGKSWTFYVEKTDPHRIIKWETSEGEEGKLLKSERLAYWKMNQDQFRSAVGKLGLKSRQPRTP